ncbi:alpha/beta fold hydrolase [Streptomyces sp. NPDC057623]|uniref:alpha/beta fold hydrolase n=1 Tax=Streptomyces sp. NPDC057623 TaxID=3346187 RepID=UPI0036C60632
MPPGSDFADEQLTLRVDDVPLRIAAVRRDGERAPVVFLHGFGSTKEDYVDFVHRPEFAGRPFLAYDAPGCGGSEGDDAARISVPFLVRTAQAVLRRSGIERFHVVGHSLGGLTALLLAHQEPHRVLSFVDIEGNLTSEDCFLSRQIVTHPADDDKRFVDGLVERAHRSSEYASALYAASLRHKVRPRAVRGIFESMVDLSDHGDLLTKFLALPFPRMFMYGEQNASLPYLPELAANGVELAQVPHSGHWPMYSNPAWMWARIAAFHAHTDC